MVFDVILVDGDKMTDSVFVFLLYFYGKSSNKELAMTDNTDLTCVLLAKELIHVK